MKNRLAQLETRLQTLIEGSAARLFSITGQSKDLSARLVEAMQANIRTEPGGRTWAPNLYTLQVSSIQVRLFRENPALLEELSRLIDQAGSEAGLHFPARPQIRLVPDEHLAGNEIRITASFQQKKLIDTSTMPFEVKAAEENAPQGAFLIVAGTQTFPLQGHIVNIGRSPNNDLRLDDLKVSRSHAQLRAISGKYVIFDLDSTGGTFVNGQRVQQSQLYPGDVISLAGVPLVYGQDEPDQAGGTQPYNPDMDQGLK
jgi:hypothetical protein